MYHLYGLVIDSDLPLPGVAFAESENSDLRLRFESLYGSLPATSKWFMRWYLPKGGLWLSFAKVDGGYLLTFDKLVDFLVSNDGREIICMPGSGINSETTLHLLLNQVIPLVINLRGGEALHASAVSNSQGVVAFAGPTGSGKSTLAGALLNEGYPMMCDDCLTLVERKQGIYAVPAYPGLRLWEDSLSWLFGDNNHRESVAHYTDKLRVAIERKSEAYCGEPRPVRCIYAVADQPEPKGKTDILIERPSTRESFMTLVKCAFRLDITDRNMLTRQFRFLERVASTVSIRRLIFPRDFKLLPAAREAILADLKDLDN
jgi:hypothetical protein